MTALAPDFIAQEGAQLTFALRPTLTGFAGYNAPLAEFIAAETGDHIPAPARTLGFMDDEGRTFALALHSGDVIPNAVLMSFVPGDLPLSRDVLVPVAVTVFDVWGFAALVTLVLPGDLDRRAALGRLGFRSWGRLPFLQDRIILRLTPETLPARYLRLRRRRLH